MLDLFFFFSWDKQRVIDYMLNYIVYFFEVMEIEVNRYIMWLG